MLAFMKVQKYLVHTYALGVISKNYFLVTCFFNFARCAVVFCSMCNGRCYSFKGRNEQ